MQETADPSADATSLRAGLTPLRRLPINTYRLQLTPAFGLADAARALQYLRQLGVTDCYTSPYFTAGRGSPSGYDVCDPSTIHPEFGGEAAFEGFATALTTQGLGHVIDCVPNHMGTDEVRNRWWRDVLKRGPSSPFASYFDIDWCPVKPELRDKLLLPILDKQYGAALDAGDVRLERTEHELVVCYGDRRLPLAAGTFAGLTDTVALTPDVLHTILERQVYRLASWRTASDEINYRRFFDVDGLVGLRTEDDDVFDAVHARLARLVDDGVVTSVRVDHPDGLADPRRYFASLQALLRREDGAAVHIVAEKITTEHETLPEDWSVHGTTGYEFLNDVGGLFVHPPGMARIRRTYARFTSQGRAFEDVAYHSKKLIMSTTLASEIQMLAHAFNRISERHRRSRDFTLNSLRRALTEFISCLATYRTYAGLGGPGDRDAAQIRQAAGLARQRNHTLETSVFRFLESVLLCESGGPEREEYPARDEADRRDRRRVTARLQQFTGSVYGKGIEDTAFYRYQPLLSLNEVGGAPGLDGRTPEAFHRRNAWRAERSPFGMLTTATHDTKLGEDVRARLSVLSELPDEWARQWRAWRRETARGRTASGRAHLPDADDEYRFFQAVAGLWPFAGGEAVGCGEPAEDYVTRLTEFMRKSAREGKRHTSWINVNAQYEDALTRFVNASLTGDMGARLRDRALGFIHRIARTGVVNSLAQLVLKLGSPGVVDVYQGGELWDLNLVDPDNRRPVDFDRRARALAGLESLIERAAAGEADAGPAVRALLDEWPSGHLKLFVTAGGLRLRRRRPDLFLGAAYRPLNVETRGTPDLVAFLRQQHEGGVMVAAPRFVAGLMEKDGDWPLGGDCWVGGSVRLPQDLGNRPLRNILTGQTVSASTDADGPFLPAGVLFTHCPVGIWTWG